jgi:hypothetical protein
VEFTWNPGGPEDASQVVNVEFLTEADGTRVTLTHRGWHLAGAAVSMAGPAQPAGCALHRLELILSCYAAFLEAHALVLA